MDDNKEINSLLPSHSYLLKGTQEVRTRLGLPSEFCNPKCEAKSLPKIKNSLQMEENLSSL